MPNIVTLRPRPLDRSGRRGSCVGASGVRSSSSEYARESPQMTSASSANGFRVNSPTYAGSPSRDRRSPSVIRCRCRSGAVRPVAVSRPVHAKQVRLALIPYRRADTAQPGGAHDLL